MEVIKKVLQNWELSPQQVTKITTAFSEHIFISANDFFIHERQVPYKIGFIIKGACRHFYLTTTGQDVTRWVSLPGNFVTSLPGFIAGKPAVENIQAMKPTEMLVASKQKWDALFNENEFVRNIWLAKMEELYAGMEERVYQLIALNAEERYRLICSNHPEFILTVPDKYLASMLGITPRHLTRLRNKKI